MAALDFPPSSESPFIAPNGVVYVWNDDGYWEADTSEVPSSDNTFLKLDASNDPITGNLSITGGLDVTTKVTAASTTDLDSNTTLVTKDYLNQTTNDALLWNESGGNLYPKTLSNNVGIGTDNPTVPLQVNSEGGIQIRLQDTRNTNRYGDIQTTGSLYLTARLDDQRGAIVFRGRNDVDTVEYGRWTGSGSFSIGTDAPKERLHCVGSLLSECVTYDLNQNGAYLVATGNGYKSGSTGWNETGFQHRLKTDSGGVPRVTIDTPAQGEVFCVNNNGSVGIGTDSPKQKLSLANFGNIGIQFEKTGGAADNKTLLQYYTGDTIYWQALDDSGGGGGNLIRMVRSGNNINSFECVKAGNTWFKVDNATANVGIGTDSPSYPLSVVHPTLCQITVRTENKGEIRLMSATDESGHAIRFGGNNGGSTEPRILRFLTTGNAERMRIDKDGNLLIGTTSARTVGAPGNQAKLQIESASNEIGFSFVRNTNDNVGGIISLGHARGTQVRSTTLVNKDDALGEIRFVGADGNNLSSVGAAIKVEVDGDPGTDNMPGRLVFSTTAEGASTPTARMRIDSTGRFAMGEILTRDSTLSLRPSSDYDGSNIEWNVLETGGKAPSSVTGKLHGISVATLPAEGVTVNTYNYFRAYQNPLTNGTAIGTQRGFFVENNLTGANANYGFYSNIAAGSGRWNFYASGDARNYFAGETLFGTNDISLITGGTTDGAYFRDLGILLISRNGTTVKDQIIFYNPNGRVGSITTTGSTTAYNETSDYRLKENIAPLTGAADQLKALKPCVYNFKADPSTTLQGFIAHEAQEVCPQAVTGTKDETEAIGTLFDWDGKVREEDVTEPEELTYSEEVIDDPGQEGKEAVYSEPALIQEYQPAVWGDPELIKAADEESDAVYGDPVLISPEVPEQWSEPELISPAVEHREPTYKTVARQMSWKKTGDRDVMQGIDKSKLVPLLTAALQEALVEIDALKGRLDAAGI